MTTPTDDKLLDEYLSGRSRVSAHYRAMDTEGVPSHLDDRVLAQARAAVAAPVDEVSRLRARRRRLMRWGVPTAIAASSLLVISIVIRSGTQHELHPAAVPTEAPAMAKQQAEADATDATDATQGVVLIAPPRNAVSESSPLAPSPTLAARERQQREMEQTQARSVAASAELARQAMQDQSLPVAAPQLSQVPAAPPPPAPAAAISEREPVSERRLRALEAPAAAKQSVAQADEESALRGSAPAFTTAAPAPGDASVDRTQPDPWLEYIRRLRREDRHEEADREWRAFREQYPDHVVSETDIARDPR